MEADRISILLCITVPCLYLLLKMEVHPHYFMVILPAFFVLASSGLEGFPRIGKNHYDRYLFLAVMGISMLGMTGYWQQRVLKGHGHYREFGPSGNYLTSIAEELDGSVTWNLRIVPDKKAGKKLDPIASLMIFDRHMQPDGVPKLLILEWDDREQTFHHRFEPPLK